MRGYQAKFDAVCLAVLALGALNVVPAFASRGTDEESHSLQVSAGIKQSDPESGSLNSQVIDIKGYINVPFLFGFGFGVRQSEYLDAGIVKSGDGLDVTLDGVLRTPRLSFGKRAGLLGYAKIAQTVFSEHEAKFGEAAAAQTAKMKRHSTTVSGGVEWVTGLSLGYAISIVAEGGYSRERLANRGDDSAFSRIGSDTFSGFEVLAGLRLTH